MLAAVLGKVEVGGGGGECERAVLFGSELGEGEGEGEGDVDGENLESDGDISTTPVVNMNVQGAHFAGGGGTPFIPTPPNAAGPTGIPFGPPPPPGDSGKRARAVWIVLSHKHYSRIRIRRGLRRCRWVGQACGLHLCSRAV